MILHHECLDMLFEMCMAFAKAAPEDFKKFYYDEYMLPSEKCKKGSSRRS